MSDFLFCYIFTLCQQKIYHHLRRARTLRRPQPRTHTHTEKHIWAHDTSIYAHTHTERERRTCVHVVVLRCIARKHTNNNLYTRASSHCSSLLLARSSKQPPPAPAIRPDPPSQPTNPLANWLTDCRLRWRRRRRWRPTDRQTDRPTDSRPKRHDQWWHACMYVCGYLYVYL